MFGILVGGEYLGIIEVGSSGSIDVIACVAPVETGHVNLVGKFSNTATGSRQPQGTVESAARKAVRIRKVYSAERRVQSAELRVERSKCVKRKLAEVEAPGVNWRPAGNVQSSGRIIRPGIPLIVPIPRFAVALARLMKR